MNHGLRGLHGKEKNMNDFRIKRVFSSYLLAAIPCSVMTILCSLIAFGAVINKSWLWLVIEVFIAYCFAASVVHYWHRYFIQKKIFKKST